MATTGYAQAERQALADLLIQLGPDAPTLCTGWKTRDLAAHLVLREHRPDAAVGILVPQLAAYTAKVQREVTSRRYEELVATVRRGPPYPMRLVDEQINTVEYFVHHEDVRRAIGDVPVRQLEPGMQEVLWRRLRVMVRLTSRKVPVGLVYEWPGQGSVTARRGDPEVTVSGLPSELTLFAFGRGGASSAELSGDEASVDRLQRTPLGF
jgi:uncharacterized protein (TIGR03085 family)